MKDTDFGTNLIQIVFWVILLMFIIFRIFNYSTKANNWIWIINYIGMSIALINLFVNKCIMLKRSKSKKYRPFKGLTIFVTIIMCLLSYLVKYAQSFLYADCLNDVITLLALFFSLSQNIWDYIFNKIVFILKK